MKIIGGIAMNYSETLAYWYLRLNGFFPVRNFVLHRTPRSTESNQYDNADVDLLAVRFPSVHEKYEYVNRRDDQWDDHWDKKLLEEIPKLNRDFVGLIVEVKTGANSSNLSSFNETRIRADIHRLGMFESSDTVNKLTEDLQKRKIVSKDGYSIGKVLISERPKPGMWINIPLTDIDNYLHEHMKKYIDPKYASRHMFPDDLIQYIIWKERH